jgi:NAD(P)-dependent dehydrogenase (short-subunit alcohol dehydrogenase family)
MARNRHTLIIGGTGMLQAASVALAQKTQTLTSIARTEQSLSALRRKLGAGAAHFNPAALDYRDDARLRGTIEAAIREYGPIDLVVAWIHSVAPRAAFEIASMVGATASSSDFYHVLGSSAADPSREYDGERAEFSRISNVRYHRIVLGFVLEGRGARWLSNEEISRGVLDAIATNAPEHVVGVVEPWSKRP